MLCPKEKWDHMTAEVFELCQVNEEDLAREEQNSDSAVPVVL